MTVDRQAQSLAAAARDLAQRLASKHAADADIIAQAAVCAQPIVASHSEDAQRVMQWLQPVLAPWERHALSLAAASPPLPLSLSLSRHTYDLFLHHYSRPDRKRHGVFFTPEPIARFIVAQVDRILDEDFAPQGSGFSKSEILNPKSEILFLDPACGTGVFLLAVIDHIHARLKQRSGDWNAFVPHLLPRLIGIELLPVPAFLAKLNLAMRLAATGYDFRHAANLQIHVGDALCSNLQFAFCNSQFAVPILLGNPPFSSLTTPTNPWIGRLVRGEGDVRGYMQAGELRLGERKTWLHDDYVKFIRLAQWHVEQAGRGIVAFITNHGYLDNTTFRLMRHELARVFSRIEIVDLHGSRKNGEIAPNGSRDENVFGLDQGVAIGLFTKLTRRASERVPHVEYAELWGTREQKLVSLANAPSLALRACQVALAPPHWRFVPTDSIACPAYDAGWPLTEAMPVNASAPVTARDHFVVAFTEEELRSRIVELRDLTIPDDEIRRRYFNRTRSRRYPPGDTRGWKLSEVRRAVAADERWPESIRRCLYRPFDWRYVFWHPAMIDWPRNEVTRHLIEMTNDQAPRTKQIQNPKSKILNLCLITRRQQLPTQPCAFFWIADGLALDGVIRSDNRGSESLFPVWLAGDDGRANFASEFVADFERLLGRSPTADELLGYVYALFHSPTYRDRYASRLREDFPRVLVPASGELFDDLAPIGQRLIELHLLREGVGSLWRGKALPNGNSSPTKDSRPLSAQPLSLRIGGYDLPRKWLQPKHRSSADADHTRIAAAIGATLPRMQRIDAAIAHHGGFPAAFVARTPLSQHC